MADLAATVPCFTPKRVPVSQLLDDPPPVVAAVGPTCTAPAVPTGPCPICPRLAAEFEPWRQAAYWKSMHERAVEREKLLQEEIARLQAQLRLREQQLFGRKSEAGAASEALPPPQATAKKPRGQQRGQPGPRRRDYSHLPAVEEVLDLSPRQQRCSGCGLPFQPFPGTDDSEILEVEVKAYRRVVRRRRYRPTCACGQHPGLDHVSFGYVTTDAVRFVKYGVCTDTPNLDLNP